MKIASMVKYTEKGKLVKKAQYAAFADEMDKIAGSFLANLGHQIKLTAGGAARSTADWAKTQPKEIGSAVADHMHPISAIKKSWNQSKWMGMKGLTAAGAAMEGADAIKKKDPTGQGRGRGERLGGAAAGIASGLVTMRHGFVPAVATGLAASYAGGKAGKKIDKMMKYAPPGAAHAPPPERT